MSTPERPDDRPVAPAAGGEDPQLFILVGSEKFPRPGLETYFAAPPDSMSDSGTGCGCHPVVGVYCSCNRVCSCVPVCSCVGHGESSGGGGGGCSCAPVH